MAASRLEDATQRVESQLSELQVLLRRFDATPANERWTLDQQIDSKVNELNATLSRMAADAHTLPRDDCAFWEGEIAKFREDVSTATTELRQKRSATQNQLSETTQRAGQAGDAAIAKLDEALGIGQKTIEVIDKTKQVLVEDREGLGRIQGNVDGVKSEADKGAVRLKRMFCRAVCHKILIWTVVAVLGAAFVVSCIVQFSKKKQPEPATPLPTRTAAPPPTATPTASASPPPAEPEDVLLLDLAVGPAR
jgi:hypothetical protein